MKLTSIVGAALAVILVAGCSSSSAPPNNYPLLLSIVSDSMVSNTALFNFRVTKDGAPVANAKLRRTNFPSNQTTDLGIQSDTGGRFPRVIVILTDTLTGVAYQAVRDTLSSNYIRWP